MFAAEFDVLGLHSEMPAGWFTFRTSRCKLNQTKQNVSKYEKQNSSCFWALPSSGKPPVLHTEITTVVPAQMERRGWKLLCVVDRYLRDNQQVVGGRLIVVAPATSRHTDERAAHINEESEADAFCRPELL